MPKRIEEGDESSVDFLSESDDDFSIVDSEEDVKKKKKSSSTPSKKRKTVTNSNDTTSKSSATKKVPTPKKKVKSDSDDDSSKIVPQQSRLSSSDVTEIKGLHIDGDITRGPDIATESEARKVILAYFRQQNRPYSAIQVHENLHKRAARSVVEKALTTLCESNSGLLCKEYSKSKIYYVDQNTLPIDKNGDLDKLENDLDDLQEQVNLASERDKKMKFSLAQLVSEPLDCELDSVLVETEARMQVKQERVTSIKKQNIDVETMTALIKKHNHVRSLWKQRKDICKEALEQISEGMNKKVKDLKEEIGIELDEDVGCKLPDNIPEPKKTLSRS